MDSVIYSSTTPAANAGKKLAHYQTDGFHVSHEFDLDVKINTRAATGTVSVDAIETIELCTAAADITRTLPDAADWAEKVIVLKKIDAGAGAVNVAPHAGQNIDGNAVGVALTNQNQYTRLISDGTTVYIIGGN